MRYLAIHRRGKASNYLRTCFIYLFLKEMKTKSSLKQGNFLYLLIKQKKKKKIVPSAEKL